MSCESFFEIHTSLLFIVVNLPRLEGLKLAIRSKWRCNFHSNLFVNQLAKPLTNILTTSITQHQTNIQDKNVQSDVFFDFHSYLCHLVWCPHTSPRFFWPSVSSFIASTTSFHQTSISSISSLSSTTISPLFLTPHTSLYPCSYPHPQP